LPLNLQENAVETEPGDGSGDGKVGVERLLKEGLEKTEKEGENGPKNCTDEHYGDPSKTPENDLPDEPLLVIEPSKGWLPLNLADLWRCGDLLFFFAWRDVKVHGTRTVHNSTGNRSGFMIARAS
jgi:hypothetical protein